MLEQQAHELFGNLKRFGFWYEMNPKNIKLLDENPFANIKIENWEILNEVEKRSACVKCNKSRKYFCYTCYIPVKELEGRIPQMKLPVKIDIIKHNREIDGKSTAAHAAVLAPDDVSIYTYPCIPDYDSKEKVVLVFPGKEAKTISEVFGCSRLDDGEPSKKKSCENSTIRAIFIDSTWNQSRGIYKDPRLRSLPCVVLQSRISQFWRHQNGSPRWYLATIEAIHQFLVELDSLKNIYDGQYDNLLFFFRYMYSKIHSLYNHEDLKAYKRPLV